MIPSKDTIQKEILVLLNDDESHTVSEVVEKMIEHFKLTDAEQKELTPMAKRPKFYVRVLWAVSELRKAILLENIGNKLGTFKITPRGKKVIQSNPPSINTKYLKQFSEYAEWLKNTDNVKKINKSKQQEKLSERFGLVSYIDMLGTKESWKKTNSKNIPDTWNKFTKKFNNSLELTFEKNIKMTFNTFSDTIIITVENDDVKFLLKKFGIAVWSLIADSIELGIPIRGCFSIGKFFHKGNFFIGEAISEAAHYYELPQWVGMSASPSAHVEIEKLSKIDPSIFTYYHKYAISLKHAIEQEAWTIKWPELYDTMNIANGKNGSDTNISALIDAHLEKTRNIDIALKWRNTKKFYDDVTGQSTK